jgi:hypothetical protein
MKHLFTGILAGLVLTLTSLTVQSQSMFMVHEDEVNLDMVLQYEETARTFQQYLTEHNFGMALSAGMTNDMRYFYTTPIEKYGDLDNMGEHWGALTEAVGEEQMNALWAKFDACYDAHRNYVLYLDEELSYYPSGDIMADDGNARKWTYLYAHPDKVNDLREVSKKWKALYEKHGIEDGYRVYTGGLGIDFGMMLIVSYGKDLADIIAREKATQEKTAAEGQQLWMESIPTIRKVDVKYGQMRPDLSYYPEE